MKKRSLKFLALGISAVMMMGTLGACGSSKSDSSTADGSSFVITLYPSGDGTGGSSETIKGEFSQNGVENNLSHTRGVVSMARSNDPDSASSQFFICYSDDDTFLDGQYAAFGKVTEGMDVVDSFLKVERSLGSDGAQSSPNQDIVMEKVKMIDDDSDGNPRVEITMNDFLNE